MLCHDRMSDSDPCKTHEPILAAVPGMFVLSPGSCLHMCHQCLRLSGCIRGLIHACYNVSPKLLCRCKHVSSNEVPEHLPLLYGQRYNHSADKLPMLCSAGGVTLTNASGSIVCANTLDDRLKIAYSQNLPKIRESLFGLEAPVRA